VVKILIPPFDHLQRPIGPSEWLQKIGGNPKILLHKGDKIMIEGAAWALSQPNCATETNAVRAIMLGIGPHHLKKVEGLQGC